MPPRRALARACTLSSMHPRDACILALARRLAGSRPSFADAVGALSTAVTRIIPAGRIFVLGATPDGPIVGSAISGIGIAPGAHDVTIVRVGADGRVLHLDAWLAAQERAPQDVPPNAVLAELRAATPPRDVARDGAFATSPRSEAPGHA